MRATAAATLSYVLALQVSKEPTALTAALTALLVVQVTLYSTLTVGVRRIAAVVLGVLIAIGFSAVVGLSWWSLALIILAALWVGRLVRMDESVNEVAISAMLVLSVTRAPATQAWVRVFETLIGAGVGLLFNLVLAPPVWVDPAAASIEDLARRVRGLLVRLGEELTDLPVQARIGRVEARLYEARQLDQHVAEVDEALRQAEDSLRLNPRISEGLLSRLVLRTGLDTLEICVVVVRVLSRSLADLAKRRDEDEPLFPREVAASLADLFGHIGAAVVSFAVMVTTQVTASADDAERRLASEMSDAWVCRENVAQLLLGRVQRRPDAWQLHGSLLADVDRVLDELDLEHRSRRLMEELDRASLRSRERYARIGWLGRLARGERLRPRRPRRRTRPV